MEGASPFGMHIHGRWFLSPQEALAALQQGALLVDLRSDDLVSMKAFFVPEAIAIPHTTLPDHVGELPRDRLLILADSSGVYTRGAAATLEALGFGRLALLNGGMLAWDQAGLPVITDPEALLHGDCACVMRSKKANP
jgi:rhodanese-related sulfurtransferase